MEEVRNKREREENNDVQEPSKRPVTPVTGEQEEHKTEEEEPSSVQPPDKDGDNKMDDL